MIMIRFYDRQLGFSQQKLSLATLPESLDKHILGQILTNGNELVVVSRGPMSRLGFGTVYATSSLGLVRSFGEARLRSIYRLFSWFPLIGCSLKDKKTHTNLSPRAHEEPRTAPQCAHSS